MTLLEENTQPWDREHMPVLIASLRNSNCHPPLPRNPRSHRDTCQHRAAEGQAGTTSAGPLIL